MMMKFLMKRRSEAETVRHYLFAIAAGSMTRANVIVSGQAVVGYGSGHLAT